MVRAKKYQLGTGGTMLLIARLEGWHHTLGEMMVITGFLSMLINLFGASPRNPDSTR